MSPAVCRALSHRVSCLQVAAAVSYMHAHDVIHLDLTSQNLLVADGGNAKVRKRALPFEFMQWRSIRCRLKFAHCVAEQGLLGSMIVLTTHVCAVEQVADFNLSRRIQQHTGMTHSGSINSPQWSAPERLSGDDYSFPADVFSFGVILWELSTLSASVWLPTHSCLFLFLRTC